MKNTSRKTKISRRRTAIGMGVGLTLGIVLGAAMGNVALGLAVGIVVGGMGVLLKRWFMGKDQ